MRVAVLFDSPYPDWGPADFAARLEVEMSWDYEGEAWPEYQVAWGLGERGHDVTLLGAREDPTYVTEFLRENPQEMVFNLAEGFNATDELDYLLPAMLEAEEQPYTGASPQALMLTRNKAMSKKVLAHHGVNVPAFQVYRIGERPNGKQSIEFPAIVKPLRTDASVGISKASVVRDAEALADRVAFVHEQIGDAAIVEQFIEGRELYVGVLGNGRRPQLLPYLELAFDKSSPPDERIATEMVKWDDDHCLERNIRLVFARPLSAAAQDRIAETCRVAYRALWLRDYARFDLRLDADDNVWVLEGNANPFIGVGHELACAAEKAGLDYPALVDRIVRVAARRYHNRREVAA